MIPASPLAASLPFPAVELPLALSVCNQAFPFFIYMEPSTPKKILRPCTLILPRLDGVASRVGSYVLWSPGSSFSLNCTFCFLCKRNGYCISAFILAVAVWESKLCLKTAVSSRRAGKAHCTVLSDLPVNRADDMSLEMIVQLSNNSAEK